MDISCLRQGVALLERLDAERISGASELCPGGTVGGHFRHCLDFFGSFLDGLESGRIDYTERERDRGLESDPQRAAERFRTVLRAVEAIRESSYGRLLEVRGDGSRDGDDGWSRSTVGRELQFLLSHTVHHFALIGFMLRAAGCEVDASFGVAPSTLQYWKKTAAPPS